MDEISSGPSRTRKSVWSRYWASGALHSCGTSYSGNYEGPVADFWSRCFESLPIDACVLDIATGNGPVPQLLFARSGQQVFRCEAVDVADISPLWPATLPVSQRSRLRFHSGVSAEALPFDAQAFDLVTSQYGIEYSRLDKALPEIARVLRPGGSLYCVLHHSHALTVRLAQEELRHIKWILKHDGLLDLGLALIEPLERARTAQGRAALVNDAPMNELRDRYNTVQNEAQARIAAASCPDVIHEARTAVTDALGEVARGRRATACKQISDYREAVRDAALRLSELRDCALSDGHIGVLRAMLASLGISARVSVLADKRGIYGWALEGKSAQVDAVASHFPVV